MIYKLHVYNIALLKNVEIEFTKGLNVITGETGAGKSILIDSLNFVLGDRADKSLIGSHDEYSEVSVVFTDINNKKAIALLNSYNIPYEGEIIINRTLTLAGKNECRINGKIITVSQIRTLVSLIVDIHLQHQNQFLLNENNHITIFDEFINEELFRVQQQYSKDLEEYYKVQKYLEKVGDKLERALEIEVLEHQINEIQKANILENEEDELVSKRNIIQNQEYILNSLGEISTILKHQNEIQGENIINKALKTIRNISRYNQKYLLFEESLKNINQSVSSLISDIDSELEAIMYSNEEKETLNNINIRIDLIRLVKKKYGSNIEEINLFLDKAKNRHQELIKANEIEKKMILSQQSLFSSLKNHANLMHNIRNKYKQDFENAILTHLKDLDMKYASFYISIEKSNEDDINSYKSTGIDKILFQISPNLGQPLKPLNKIVSGGEMSRIMVGIKNLTADLENIDTLVFDEIDTGLSGKVAKTMATKLFNISQKFQLISITHLPQIAAMADNNLFIQKFTHENTTITEIKKLNSCDLVQEVMRLSGSIHQSSAAITNANELIDWAKGYKKSKIQP